MCNGYKFYKINQLYSFTPLNINNLVFYVLTSCGELIIIPVIFEV